MEKIFKVYRYRATQWTIGYSGGSDIPGAPIVSDDHQHEMIRLADFMNFAFDLGKKAQKMETETSLLAELCR